MSHCTAVQLDSPEHARDICSPVSTHTHTRPETGERERGYNHNHNHNHTSPVKKEKETDTDTGVNVHTPNSVPSLFASPASDTTTNTHKLSSSEQYTR